MSEIRLDNACLNRYIETMPPATAPASRRTKRRFDSPQQEAFLNLWRTYDRMRLLEEQLWSALERPVGTGGAPDGGRGEHVPERAGLGSGRRRRVDPHRAGPFGGPLSFIEDQMTRTRAPVTGIAPARRRTFQRRLLN